MAAELEALADGFALIQIPVVDMSNQAPLGTLNSQCWQDRRSVIYAILAQEPDHDVPIKKSGEINCMVTPLCNARSQFRHSDVNQSPHVNLRRTPVHYFWTSVCYTRTINSLIE